MMLFVACVKLSMCKKFMECPRQILVMIYQIMDH